MRKSFPAFLALTENVGSFVCKIAFMVLKMQDYLGIYAVDIIYMIWYYWNEIFIVQCCVLFKFEKGEKYMKPELEQKINLFVENRKEAEKALLSIL